MDITRYVLEKNVSQINKPSALASFDDKPSGNGNCAVWFCGSYSGLAVESDIQCARLALLGVHTALTVQTQTTQNILFPLSFKVSVNN